MEKTDIGIADKLAKLELLRASGVLSDQEFEKLKGALIGDATEAANRPSLDLRGNKISPSTSSDMGNVFSWLFKGLAVVSLVGLWYFAEKYPGLSTALSSGIASLSAGSQSLIDGGGPSGNQSIPRQNGASLAHNISHSASNVLGHLAFAGRDLCAQHFTVYRSETTKLERDNAVVAYHRQCVAKIVETGECSDAVTVPDYGPVDKNVSTGVFGALKIVNKASEPVTAVELIINNRNTPECHWKGSRVLEEGDSMTTNSTACGDIISVQLRTSDLSCSFRW